jgi:hypothetical protein
VKQLGFAQFDTTVALGYNETMRLLISLAPVAYRLSAVSASTKSLCTADAEMTAGGLLEELKTNAEREQLLRTTYPFQYRLARTRQLFVAGVAEETLRDTALFNSSFADAYVPGKVVREEQRGGHSEREMRIPQLVDFAGDPFLSSHCFYYNGRTREAGRPAYVVRFEPNSDISAPDVRGSVVLDSATLQIKKAVFALTRGEDLEPPVLDFEITTTYSDAFPGVSLFSSIVSKQTFPRARPTDLLVDESEVQRLTAVHFLGIRPDGARDIAAGTPSANKRDTTSSPTRRPSPPGEGLSKPVVTAPTALDGVVTDSLQRPLSGVEILADSGGVKTVTDSAGAFHLAGLPTGRVTFAVRKIGYGGGDFTLQMDSGAARYQTIVMHRFENVLSTVVVEGSAIHEGLREVGFYERSKNARGTFLTPEILASRNAARVSEMLLAVNGVRVTTGLLGGIPYGTGTIISIGGHPGIASGLCVMNVYVDGVRTEIGDATDRGGGEGGTISLNDVISAGDVGAIEVYPSGVTSPQQFSGVSRGCGTIVIWSKVKLNSPSRGQRTSGHDSTE